MKNTLSKDLASFSFPRWNRGQLIAFSGLDGPTPYKTGLIFRTMANPPGIQLVYPEKLDIAFRHAPKDAVVSSDFFSFSSKAGETKGCLLDAHHLLISSPTEDFAWIGGDSAAVKYCRKGNRLLIGSAEHFNPALIDADMDENLAARQNWILNQPILNKAPASDRAVLFRALSVMKGQVCAPEGVFHQRWTTPDRWPHKDMWLWDSAFHAIGWRHLDPALAREMIDTVIDRQVNGFIPHQMSPDGKRSIVTQPPILAYGMKLVNDAAPDIQWIKRNYGKLAEYIEWDFNHRTAGKDKLAGWLIEDDPMCRSGESGMDNSPRFDKTTQLAAVDFNSYLAQECEVMTEFAVKLRDDAAALQDTANAEKYEKDAARWREHHLRLCAAINARLWSKKDQIYCDSNRKDDSLSPTLSSAGFLPMICGAPTEEQVKALTNHLGNKRTFGTAFPVPSIAAADPAYSKDMWRGPTWINMNWMIARGLERYNRPKLARKLDLATMKEIRRQCKRYGTFFEYFDDRREVSPPRLLRKGKNGDDHPHMDIHDYGWTTTLYLDLFLRLKGLPSALTPKTGSTPPDKGSAKPARRASRRPGAVPD